MLKILTKEKKTIHYSHLMNCFFLVWKTKFLNTTTTWCYILHFSLVFSFIRSNRKVSTYICRTLRKAINHHVILIQLNRSIYCMLFLLFWCFFSVCSRCNKCVEICGMFFLFMLCVCMCVWRRFNFDEWNIQQKHKMYLLW